MKFQARTPIRSAAALIVAVVYPHNTRPATRAATMVVVVTLGKPANVPRIDSRSDIDPKERVFSTAGSLIACELAIESVWAVLN